MYDYPARTADYRLTAGSSFYPTRRNGPVLGIVLHVTAGLQDTDMVGPDVSAEGTARWALSSGAEVSWHVGVDSDSIVPCLPDTYTGWHAKGYNSRSWGVEISNKDAVWGNKPKDWVEATLRNAAKACAPIVRKYGLPLELASRATVDQRIAAGRPFGFTYHSHLSDIRTDPGRDFPWSRFLTLLKAELGTTATPQQQEDDMPTTEEFWRWDGIPSPDKEAANPNWRPDSYLRETFRLVRSTRTDLLAQITALSAAVTALAQSQDADPDAIADVVAKAVKDRLAQITLTDEGDQP